MLSTVPKVWRDGDVDVIQRYHLTRQHLVELKVPFPQDSRVLALQLGPLNVLHLGMQLLWCLGAG